MVTNIQFKNIDKIFPKNKISKMRTEDLIRMYDKKNKFMSKIERQRWNRKIFGTTKNSFPLGHELLVERRGGKLKFIPL